jgi:monoamine oxidase
MNDRASGVDVAIVGGGAAGIAAARHLVGLRRSVLLIEALSQLGGRARTTTLHAMPLDLGCGWLHSARRNPLALLAEAQGQPLDRSESVWHRQLRNLHFPPSEQRDAWTAFRQLGERLRNDPPPSDCAADAMASDDKWRPFVDGVSSFVNGTELNRLSAADYVAYDDAATDDNWRLPAGYGAFITGLAAGLPTALDTNVQTLSQGADIALETNSGTLHARAAIVAVSSAVLAKSGIRFFPSIDDHLHAASCLPLGVADKVYLSVGDRSAVPPESHLLGRFDRAGTGSYYLRPFGRPVIECYLGGVWAQALEDIGSQAAFAFAIGELRELLGDSFARRLTPIVATHWAREPTIRGSYSHALPGHAGARAVLARPVNERLCFAGEACSERDFSTAHGAWQSGIHAADWIERFLAAK